MRRREHAIANSQNYEFYNATPHVPTLRAPNVQYQDGLHQPSNQSPQRPMLPHYLSLHQLSLLLIRP
jgi:hypothetical protein